MELGIKITSFSPEDTKFQKTTEREVDFLYQVGTADGQSFLLHLEFQIKDNKNMITRMKEYHGMIYAKKKIPIRHVVIYLGNRKPRMSNKLRSDEIFSGFHLLNISDIEPEKLLSSQVPEVIISAILCGFPRDRIESVLRLLWTRLKATARTRNELEKYLNQLIILSRIRKFKEQAVKIIKDMTLNIDIEDSILYQRGMKKGMQKGMQEGIEKGIEKANEVKKETIDRNIQRLLLSGLLTDKQIAETLEVSMYRVRKIKSQLKKKD